jgi:hypothetical protein
MDSRTLSMTERQAKSPGRRLAAPALPLLGGILITNALSPARIGSQLRPAIVLLVIWLTNGN